MFVCLERIRANWYTSDLPSTVEGRVKGERAADEGNSGSWSAALRFAIIRWFVLSVGQWRRLQIVRGFYERAMTQDRDPLSRLILNVKCSELEVFITLHINSINPITFSSQKELLLSH